MHFPSILYLIDEQRHGGASRDRGSVRPTGSASTRSG